MRCYLLSSGWASPELRCVYVGAMEIQGMLGRHRKGEINSKVTSKRLVKTGSASRDGGDGGALSRRKLEAASPHSSLPPWTMTRITDTKLVVQFKKRAGSQETHMVFGLYLLICGCKDCYMNGRFIAAKIHSRLKIFFFKISIERAREISWR